MKRISNKPFSFIMDSFFAYLRENFKEKQPLGKGEGKASFGIEIIFSTRYVIVMTNISPRGCRDLDNSRKRGEP
jgi:hypothetical protein